MYQFSSNLAKIYFLLHFWCESGTLDMNNILSDFAHLQLEVSIGLKKLCPQPGLALTFRAF